MLGRVGRFLTSSSQFTAAASKQNLPILRTTTKQISCDVALGGKIKVVDLLDKWQDAFRKEHILEPRESIENILMHVLGTRKFADVYKLKNKVLSPREIREVDRLAALRLKKMPVQYIIGEWDFRDLNLVMRPPVFIPRPESEQLVDLALEGLKGEGRKDVLEVCCGSGAISLSLLKAKQNVNVVALDLSEEACALTKENAELNGLLDRLHVIQADISKPDVLAAILEDKKFHVIVGNPPYIPSGDLRDLQPEIELYEDKRALDGGDDGLKLITEVFKLAEQLLIQKGKLYLETDYRHPPLIKTMLDKDKKSSLTFTAAYEDCNDRLRFVEITKQFKKQ